MSTTIGPEPIRREAVIARSPSWAIVSVLLFVLIAAAMMAPGLSVGPSLDAAVFDTVGWRLSEGDVLYAEVWDHKPPGIFVPYLAAHLVTRAPVDAWGVAWILSVVAAVVATIATCRVLRTNGLGGVSTLAGFLCTLGLSAYLLTLGGGLSETYAVAPAAGAAWVTQITGARGSLRYYGAGVLGALAMLISLQLASVFAFIVIAAMLEGGDRNGVLRRLFVAAAGLASITLVAMVWVVIWGSPEHAWDALVTYNAAYRREASVGPTASLLPYVFLVLLPLIVPALLGIVALRRDPCRHSWAWAALGWLLLGMVVIAIQGRLYGHYAITLVVPLALLAGLGIKGLLHATRARVSSWRRAMLMLPLVVAIVLSLFVGAVGGSMEAHRYEEANLRAAAVAPVIAEHADEDASVLVWGNSPRLYELAERRPAMRYVYLYPILTQGYVTTERVEQLVDLLSTDPPKVIVDAGSPGRGEPGMPPLLEPRPVSTDGRDTDLLDPLRAFVRRSYQLEGEVAGWAVYTRPGE